MILNSLRGGADVLPRFLLKERYMHEYNSE